MHSVRVEGWQIQTNATGVTGSAWRTCCPAGRGRNRDLSAYGAWNFPEQARMPAGLWREKAHPKVEYSS